MIKGSKHTIETKMKMMGIRQEVSHPRNAILKCFRCGIILSKDSKLWKWCPVCKKIAQHQQAKKHRENNKEKISKLKSEKRKIVRLTCPEKRKILIRNSKEWYEKNKERCNEKTRQWIMDNPEKHHEAQKKYVHNHPEIIKAKDNRRRIRKMNALGSHTLGEFNALCEATGWKCHYCGTSLNFRTATRDHIIPLIKGGSDSIDNIAPCCRKCNVRKTGMMPEIFIQKMLEANG